MKPFPEIHTLDMPESISLMNLSETSLRPFLDEEPDLYSLSDAKVILLK
jgi:hypothetical protein